jgi:[protein-PII] uridylyltransferase
LRQQFILALDGELDVLASLDSRDRDAAQHGTTRAGEVPAGVPINHAPAPPKILWSQGAEPGELVVQIRTTDRAGLLTRLTAVFERDGVDIAWAKVTTLGSSVVDVFSIIAAGDGNSAGAPASVKGSIRDELEHDLYAVLPAPAPAKPVSEAS